MTGAVDTSNLYEKVAFAKLLGLRRELAEGGISRLIALLTEQSVSVEYMRKLEPTLEDVFLKMVGKRFEDEEATAPVS